MENGPSAVTETRAKSEQIFIERDILLLAYTVKHIVDIRQNIHDT